MCSGALALSVVLLSSLPGARLSLQQLLFGDILGIAWANLLPLALLLVVTLAYGVISRAQILINVDPVLARSRGVAVETHRLILLGLLAWWWRPRSRRSGLLIGGFVVIPACVARAQRSFNVYVLLAAGIGASRRCWGCLDQRCSISHQVRWWCWFRRCCLWWRCWQGAGLLKQPLQRLLIALAELQRRFGAGYRSHHITAQLAVAPEPKAMAQFMQCRGLNRRLPLPGADQHLHQAPRRSFVMALNLL